jgi:hypothetical protein
LRLVASTFWVYELGKQAKTKTIAGIYRYLSEHEYGKLWVEYDQATGFLYLKRAKSPIRTSSKIDRYEKVFRNTDKILDHLLFRILGCIDLIAWIQESPNFTSFTNWLPEKEKKILKSVFTHTEDEKLDLSKEQEVFEALKYECSIHTFTALLVLYLYYQTCFLNKEVYARLEKEIFCQFVQLFSIELDGKWSWLVYQIIQQHFFSLENSHFKIKPYVLIKNRKESPPPYEPMFFNHFNNEQELVAHINRHF